jgi:phosphohistidine phosphatase SixA
MLRIYAILFLCLPGPLLADGWAALRAPDTIAIMRHALAPGTSDPAEFRLGDCTTQRNLDARGREQARQIGTALRENGILFDQVLSSEWCRTRETAALLDIGEVTPFPPLNSFFDDRSTRDSQTSALRAHLAQTEGKLMIVTHQVNISALTGQSTRSGEILILRKTDEGVRVMGSILIDP